MYLMLQFVLGSLVFVIKLNNFNDHMLLCCNFLMELYITFSGIGWI